MSAYNLSLVKVSGGGRRSPGKLFLEKRIAEAEASLYIAWVTTGRVGPAEEGVGSEATLVELEVARFSLFGALLFAEPFPLSAFDAACFRFGNFLCCDKVESEDLIKRPVTISLA